MDEFYDCKKEDMVAYVIVPSSLIAILIFLSIGFHKP